ncbi:GTP cyclohydrolase FolE2 [Candidatus Pandoraea novymonadis]|uniref:GTP cyclohydrolase FolE2 n=1 Tax=Candidatus Pandoraea novymonadis TaxID=1808959 RepID=A0ABX5FGH0_9BURK|nr:GTP cyclohydrolase FolE2 [Candidatus Pandoraea novymonadis]PSB92087.1 GTP cyclohydrolase FolE2 [Candidatus Pandoraea novymonadis]
MNQINPIFIMPDVQSGIDTRQIPIQRVGVRAVRHPLVLKTNSDQMQATVAIFNMDVHLPANQKGTHMSRFIALLEENKAPFDMMNFRVMLITMLERLEADAGHMEVSFPYFISKTAPISGVESLMDYQVTLTGQVLDGQTRVWLKVLVPVTSLCPCSKQISKYGAHNQRSHVTIHAELLSEISIEEIVTIAEEEASCELWGLLKRPDEKYVTERAYENPKFVEDLVRDVAKRLNKEPRIISYKLEAENFESIHNHSAYALIEHDKRLNA